MPLPLVAEPDWEAGILTLTEGSYQEAYLGGRRLPKAGSLAGLRRRLEVNRGIFSGKS